MAVLQWPAAVGVAEFDMHPVGASWSTVGLDQVTQVATVENRVWRGTVTLANMDAVAGGAWVAFLGELRGMGGAFDLPVPDPLAVDPVDGGGPGWLASVGYTPAQIAAGQIDAFDGGILFSGGEGWALGQYANPVIADAADMGAVTLMMTGQLAGLLRAGQVFSVDAFLYRVTSVAGPVVRFAPPLRAGVAAGAQVEVIAPQIRVRLARDAGGLAPWQLAGIMPGVSIDLVEVFAR